MIQTYNTKKSKINALKAQLRFRQHVSQQKPVDSTSFTVTKVVDGKCLERTPDELCDSLRHLVNDISNIPSDGSDSMLVGKRVRHRFEEGDPPHDFGG